MKSRLPVVVSYPGVLVDAQQAARAFYETGTLAKLVTGLHYDERSVVGALCAFLPGKLRKKIARELRRRSITQLPGDLIVSYPWLDIFRTALSRWCQNPIYADSAWDTLSHRFDRTVALRHLDGVGVVYAYEYTAKYTFELAQDRGIARVLALPSTDSKEFEDIRCREEARFPELRNNYHRYFASRFAERYERRRAEIELADVIVANSEITKKSHIRAGADATKILAVPLAAPPGIETVRKPQENINCPLSVIWAGTFSIRKGAHYFLDAWRAFRAGNSAGAKIYGRIDLPERAIYPLPEGLEFKGSVPQSDLLASFEQADVLVFPTLADGFGLVVTEAFSRGLPVITTDKAGAGELVVHGENGLIIPAGDSTAILEALRWCLDNRATLYQLRFSALETARRWQWPDYRRMLVAELGNSLCRAGYAAKPEGKYDSSVGRREFD